MPAHDHHQSGQPLLTDQIQDHLDAVRGWTRRTAVPTTVRAARAAAGWVAARSSDVWTWVRTEAGPRTVRWARELDEAMVARSAADRDRSPRAAALRLAALGLVLTLVAAVAALPGLLAVDQTVASVGETLLDVEPMPDEFEPLAQRSRVVAADGSLMAILAGVENRVVVTLDEVPQVVRDAVIATEDADFYEHHGVNHQAMMRAFVANVAEQDVSQGGSTITQQYIKNALLSPDQTVQRKLQEAVYATRLEREATKDEILERYLNITYFGNGVYGIGAAAEFYFGKPVSELTAPEAALLAGLIRSPEVNEPIDNPDAAKARRDIVLTQMAAQGHLSPEEAQAAAAEPIALDVTPLPAPTHPFFVEYIKQHLLGDPRLGETRADRAALLFGGGLEIVTSLQPGAQQAALDSIRSHLANAVVDPIGGIVSLEPSTGRVLAMAVGPKTFGTCEPAQSADGEQPEAQPVAAQDPAGQDGPAPQEQPPCTQTKVNPLAPGMGGSGRQAGSTFKPILDTAALAAGVPTSWSTDTRSGTEIPECGAPGEPWRPENYSGTSAGVLDMPEGIRQSNNVFHAKLIAEIGPQTVVDMAHRLGIDSELEPFCSLGLGAQEVFPIDMAQAFGTLANDGVRCEPYAVLEVRDRHGQTLLRNEPSCERVLDPDIAATMTTMLQRVVESGTARAAAIGRPVAGKTGTTNDFADAWFIGYIPQMVTAAWMGHEQPRCVEGQTVGCGPMRNILGYRVIAGGTVPARMWADYMRVATEGMEVLALPRVSLDRYAPPRPAAPPASDGGRDDDDRGNGNGNKKRKKDKD